MVYRLTFIDGSSLITVGTLLSCNRGQVEMLPYWETRVPTVILQVVKVETLES